MELIDGALFAAKVVQNCVLDDECGHLKMCVDSICTHKDFWPLAPTELLGGFFLFLVSAMANAAGITGCSMIIPILIIVGGFTTHWAIPIAQLVAFTGVAVAIIMRFTLRHPSRDRPRIDFNLSMHICMPLLLGTCYGVIVNAMLPDWFILICLTLTFAFGSLGTYRKANTLAAKEDKEAKDGGKPLLEQAYEFDRNPNHSEELQQICKDEARSMPPVQLGMIIIMWAFTLLAAFARGGKGLPSFFGFAPCSGGYWWFTIGFSVVCVAIIVASAIILVNKYLRYAAAGYKFENDDMKWTQENSNRVIFVSLMTGLICGCLGLTGGVFLGPMLLWLGVRTETSTATCSFVVSFSSSVAFVQYWAAGMVKLDYGLYYSAWGGAGALLGVALLERKMKETGKPSISVYILSAVLGMATILVPIYGVMRVMDLVNRGQFSFGFRNFC